jgi:hypothetical protein
MDADGAAENEADHFMEGPGCSQWFDMRDLAQVAEHIQTAARLKILEGPEPPPRENPVH